MGGPRVTGELVGKVKALRAQGLKAKPIAESLGVSVTTVGRVLMGHYENKIQGRRTLASDLVEASIDSSGDMMLRVPSKLIASAFQDIIAKLIKGRT
jgi:orotate phosphoribosyltransferase-like protein